MSASDSKLPRRRSIRLKGYNYGKAGAYFLTICTYQHSPLFGTIRNGQMVLNELGTIVRDSWLSTAEKRSNLSLDQFVVMPNHLHGIILISETTHVDRPLAASQPRPVTPGKLSTDSLGTIVGQFKGVVTKRAKTRSNLPASRIWQRNFYERIIRDEDSLNKIRAYIVENPSRWSEDSLYTDKPGARS